MSDSNPYAPPEPDFPEKKTEHTGPSAASVDQVDEDSWADWPVCPECNRRRQTVCPVCDTPGIDFPLVAFHGVEELASQADQAPPKQGCGCNDTTHTHQDESTDNTETQEKCDPHEKSCGCSTGTASTGTAPTDEPLKEEELMLMCHTCDDAFRPRYHRYCPWCNHDFGSGIEPEQTFYERENLTPQAVIAMVGIGIVLAAGILYLMLI